MNAYRIGFFSSILIIVEVFMFAVSLVPSFWGVDLHTLSFFASFWLAPTFITVMVCIHYLTHQNMRIWSQLGIAFAIIYAVMVMLTYYTQLVIVRSNALDFSAELLKLLSFTPGSLMFAFDMLGYGFMCLSTLITAPVFHDGKLNTWIRRLFIINGLFSLPSLVFPAFISHSDGSSAITASIYPIIGYLFWCLLFAAIGLLLAIKFKKMDIIGD